MFQHHAEVNIALSTTIIVRKDAISYMVGIASFALGSAISRRRTQAAMSQHFHTQQTQQTQQQEIEKLKATQAAPQPQEDITQQLRKLADLHQKGILTDGEFKKAKDGLVSKL